MLQTVLPRDSRTAARMALEGTFCSIQTLTVANDTVVDTVTMHHDLYCTVEER